MSGVRIDADRTEDGAVAAAARAGDEGAFTALVQRHRRELQVHCYRMLGSFTESEDLVQETFLRAWRRRETFEGRSTFRAWLYRIATNACLDALARQAPERQGSAGAAEIRWLQPYPDRLLDLPAAGDDEPDAVVVARETIELAFLVAIQHLPPRQRAVLILRDVLGWSAAESAELLETTVASVNSASQRARATLREHLPERRAEWGAAVTPTGEERAVLQRFVEASDSADLRALAAMLREDARQTMPPASEVFLGRDAMIAAWTDVMTGPDAWDLRCLPTAVNRQPALANYLRERGATEYTPCLIDVLTIEDGLVTHVMTFGPEIFPALGLPATLPAVTG